MCLSPFWLYYLWFVLPLYPTFTSFASGLKTSNYVIVTQPHDLAKQCQAQRIKIYWWINCANKNTHFYLLSFIHIRDKLQIKTPFLLVDWGKHTEILALKLSHTLPFWKFPNTALFTPEPLQTVMSFPISCDRPGSGWHGTSVTFPPYMTVT
jgi:hypothetical protein